jgi:hypothetical protein
MILSMEEIEVPTEKLQEDITEHVEHAKHGGGGHGSTPRWISWVALTAAILAVLAAISALMAGHKANEAMIGQIHASDSWSYYQAKGVKSAVLAGRIEILRALGKEVSEKDDAKLEEYKKDQEQIADKAKEQELDSAHDLTIHETLAKSVTFFQIAIAISAISVLTRRRRFWFVSLGFGAVGAFFMALGLTQ